MKKIILIRILAVVVVFSMVSGCNTLDLKSNRTATGKPLNKTTKDRPKAPVYYDFKDVLVPGEFVENKKYSSVAENSGMATGFMSFYGPVELNSVVNFFNIKMPMDGWRPVTVAKSPLSTLMMFNKGNRWCYIELSETEFTTDLRIGISLEIGSRNPWPYPRQTLLPNRKVSPSPLFYQDQAG
ncbi:MAG: hypothetical protein WC799_21045 [Desulfobacteraceae bacterium]